MFSAPGNEGLRAEGWSGENPAEADIHQLLKSALDDVKSK
jgi:hypothetical protein